VSGLTTVEVDIGEQFTGQLLRRGVVGGGSKVCDEKKMRTWNLYQNPHSRAVAPSSRMRHTRLWHTGKWD
jgi:hypothetical protein